MVRIAFGHKAHSGKDLAADYLISHHGGKAFKFAAAIYDISRFAYERAGLPFQKNASLLQYLGTSWGRSVDENIWVNACLKDVAKHTDGPAFLTDMRFKNEARALKEAGFILVKIDRDASLKGDIGRDPTHPSEVDLDDFQGWDEILTNNGTLQEFYSKVDALYEKAARISAR